MDCRARILELAQERGIIRARDVEESGCSRNYLYEMRRAGDLRRLSAGLYALPDAQKHDLVERIESRSGLRQLEYMKIMGMGSDRYEIITI